MVKWKFAFMLPTSETVIASDMIGTGIAQAVTSTILFMTTQSFTSVLSVVNTFMLSNVLTYVMLWNMQMCFKPADLKHV